MSAKQTKDEQTLDELGVTEADLEWLQWFRDQASDDDSNERILRSGRRDVQGRRR